MHRGIHGKIVWEMGPRWVWGEKTYGRAFLRHGPFLRVPNRRGSGCVGCVEAVVKTPEPGGRFGILRIMGGWVLVGHLGDRLAPFRGEENVEREEGGSVVVDEIELRRRFVGGKGEVEREKFMYDDEGNAKSREVHDTGDREAHGFF